MARPAGFEPTTPRFVVCFSGVLPAYALYDEVLFQPTLEGFTFYQGLFPAIRFVPFCLRHAYVAAIAFDAAWHNGATRQPEVSYAKIDEAVRGEH